MQAFVATAGLASTPKSACVAACASMTMATIITTPFQGTGRTRAT
ncbi:MAG: hypothetical protein ACK41C_05640 [Phenylobacterium sp.]|jgi:hypothetical protein